jgi:hypothetical protein
MSSYSNASAGSVIEHEGNDISISLQTDDSAAYFLAARHTKITAIRLVMLANIPDDACRVKVWHYPNLTNSTGRVHIGTIAPTTTWIDNDCVVFDMQSEDRSVLEPGSSLRLEVDTSTTATGTTKVQVGFDYYEFDKGSPVTIEDDKVVEKTTAGAQGKIRSGGKFFTKAS